MTNHALADDKVSMEQLRMDVALLRQTLMQNEQRLHAMEAQIATMQDQWDLTKVAPRSNLDDADICDINHIEMTPGGFPYLARHTPIFFADGQNVGLYLFGGWWPQEQWGVWGKEDQHCLRFALDSSYVGGFIDVILNVQGFPVPNMEEAQISATANGYFLGHFTLRSHPRRLRLRMTPSCIGNGDIFLQLQHSGPIAPGDMLNSPDQRPLGLGLISLEIR
ncbi:hypothetical protein PMI04_005160 [Sphingobium sp. AP49]|uniref:hypothetical protein n=1 Tax=Sphingobium sp. AP49 TaxID=1144307 RepID=UPI00055CF0BA|nr:hypothetical protein [Sphingobium sp. AP49]WHO39985.1 hypothetical protein PMI04_005160 [Sphingobium sp. AP49]